jgi:hypothetical protein
VLKSIGYCYLNEMKNPHIQGFIVPHKNSVHFQGYVQNRMMTQDIGNQITLYCLNEFLIKNQNNIFLGYPLYIGMSSVQNSTWLGMEGENIEAYHFNLERVQIYDTPQILVRHRQ